MKKLLALLLSLTTLGATAQIRFLQVGDIEDYELVLKSARQTNQMLLVALHDGSGNFRKMYSDGIFDNPGVQQNATPYLKMAINIQEPMGARFSQIFSISEFPSFFLMNDQEFVVDVLEGYQSSNDLQKALGDASKEPYRYDSLLVKYNQHSLSDKEWIEILELYALNFDYAQTVRLAQEFFNEHNEADLLQKPYAPLLAQYGVNLETSYPQLTISNASLVKQNASNFNLEDFLDLAIEYNLDRAIISGDSSMVETICQNLLVEPLVKKDSFSYARLALHREFAMQSEKFGLYTEAFIQHHQKEAPSTAADFLFDEAYEIVENFNSASALSSALKMANASDQKLASFRAKMLEAYIAYLQKDYKTSDRFIQEARPLIKTPEQLRSLEKLQGLIKEELSDQ
ncbi:MAG: hypothetical protein NXI09_06415 [Bacteroidetes bacterium]|nr:hypothetical protein [Bacteroidota bacterium]